MVEGKFQCQAERIVPAPPGLVYALMSDTNRWDRVVGFKRSTYSYERVADTAVQVGRARIMGIDVAWIEVGEGVEARWMLAERRFLSGPVARAGYRFTTEAHAGGTRLGVTSYVHGSPLLPEPALATLGTRAEAGMLRYLDALERVIASGGPAGDPGDEPVFAWARRWLFNAPVDAVFSGPVTQVDEEALAFCVGRFAAAPVAADVRERIVLTLRTRPDEEVRQIRPFELARAWGLAPREVLRGFLYAARAGLCDLRWQLDCPTCRVGAGVEPTLEAVARSAHCADCNIAFDVDFAANVEATFTVNPAVRKVDAMVYCGASPWHRPHIYGGARVEPGEERVVGVPLPIGRLALRVARRRVDLPSSAGHPARLDVDVGDEALAAHAVGAVAAPGAESELHLRSLTRVPVTVLIERADWEPDIVSGTTLATFPEFLDLFSAEAPAAGVDLTVGMVTVLFSDLTGTTALYRRIGDARAFALVQEHFQEVNRVIAAREGAVVKTMGDAVMATFRSPAAAVHAALEVTRSVTRSARAHGVEGLSARVGVNQGPCLAVRANGRLDFFGTTVNLAARLQGQARANEVVVLAELMDRPEVARAADAEGAESRSYPAQLKGFSEPHLVAALWCVR